MMTEVSSYAPITGRRIKEDGSTVNMADVLGSNVDILLAQEGIVVPAGAYESPAPEFTFAGSPYTAYIIGGYTYDAAHSWSVQAGPKFGGDYARALYDVVTSTSTRILSDQRELIIAESIVFRISNQDTVSHTYNYYILGLKGV